MKKRILSIALALMMVVSMMPSFAIAGRAETVAAETAWYDASEDLFEIDTAAELLGFANLLSSGTTFAGKTVKLTADIDLNPGWEASATAPENKWPTMSRKIFSGTFDGDGHKISGVYLNYNSGGMGILGGGAKGATVKNLVILNSYVSGTWGIGGIFGYTNGTNTIENVYVKADIVSTFNDANAGIGGLVGSSGRDSIASADVIKNCVFSGSVSGAAATKPMGGLIGWVNISGTTVTLESCAFYGSVIGDQWDFGGLIGKVQHGAVTVSGCISAGEVNRPDADNASIGAYYGRSIDGGTVSVANSAYTKIVTGGVERDRAYNGAVELSAVEKTAFLGKVPAEISGFTAIQNAYPRPTTMIEMTADIKDELKVKYTADDSWYSDGSSLFEIDTPEELLGFATLLSGGTTFDGKTVTLTADIDINPGWRAGKTAPENPWPNVVNKDFMGTFDGNGHIISGIYLSDVGERAGIFGNGRMYSCLKNFALINSYISYIGPRVGGLFGATYGASIENVYCDVDICDASESTDLKKVGGLIGSCESGIDFVRNCVFAGTINAGKGKSVGGLVGFVYRSSLNLINCAFYGSIVTSGSEYAGLAGRLDQASCALHAEGCIIAGSIVADQQSEKSGSFYGANATTSKIEITDCRYTKMQAANSLLDQPIPTYSGVIEPIVKGYTLAEDAALKGTVAEIPAGYTTLQGTYAVPTELSTTVFRVLNDSVSTSFVGYQTATEENRSGSLRLIGIVNVISTLQSEFQSVGFDIEMTIENGNKWSNKELGVAPEIFTLYTSVEEEGKATPTTAQEIGGDYIFVATVSGINQSYADDIDFVIKTFHDDCFGNRIYDDSIVLKNPHKQTPTGIPSFESETAQSVGTYVSNMNQTQLAYTGITEQDYNAYKQKLVNEGFVLYAENTIGVNRFATYVNNSTEIHLIWFSSIGNFRIVWGSRGYLPAQKTPAYSKVTENTVTQLGREGTLENAPGLSYVIQLEDGSFVVIDGGPENEADSAALLKFLQDNKPATDNKPRVTWMFTHLHYDHVSLAVNFLETNQSNIELSAVCYNIPNMEALSGEEYCKNAYQKLQKLMKKYAHTEVFVFHSGQKLYLPGCEIEFLYTQEDLWPTAFSTANDTSAVWRMTFSGGHSFLVFGDSDAASCEQINSIYGSALKSDVLQPTHHGFNGANKALYQSVNPSICLWAVDEERFYNDTRCLGIKAGYEFNSYLRDQGNRKHYHATQTVTLRMSDLSVTEG